MEAYAAGVLTLIACVTMDGSGREGGAIRCPSESVVVARMCATRDLDELEGVG